MANTLSFMDQVQGANYQSLSAESFQVGIVDPDSSGLTTSQISSLQASGKSLIGYLSIGEAENFRSYWQPSWNSSPPSFIIGADPNWSGDYYVKYWDPAWQQTVINQAVTMAKSGYSGIMMDVVDAYTNSTVAAADGGITQARADMVKFVEAISAATKAINPHFKVIQNNALDLLTTNPDDPSSATNTAYLSHVDGVVAESTFYNPDNSATTWSAGNVQYLEHAVAAGKTVLSIDYPSSASAQQSYISKAIADGFVPYAADQSLDTNVPAIDYQVPGQLHAGAMTSVLGGATAVATTTSTPTTTTPTTTPTTSTTLTTATPTTTHTTTPATTSTSTASTAYHVTNVANGSHTLNADSLNTEFVFGSHYNGHATINYFATSSGDVLDIAPSIFSSAQQALSHTTYSGSTAIVNLGAAHGTISIVGAGAHSLTAADFHIG